MNPLLRTLFVLWAIVLLVISGVLYWFMFVKVQPPSEDGVLEHTTSTNPYIASQALNESIMYEQIRTQSSLGNTTQVHRLFRELQGLYATGTPERNVIDYDYAYFLVFTSGDVSGGIEALQSIANDVKTYEPLTRALALETLARVALAYNNPDITTRIFGEEPFASLLSDAGGVQAKAVTSLFKMAIDVHPTPLASLRVAKAKAEELSANIDLGNEDRELLTNEFYGLVALADAQIKLVEGQSAFNDYRAAFFGVKALAFSEMYYALKKDEDKAMAVRLFKDAIILAHGSTQVFARYYYAVFLSQVDAPPEDIAAVIMAVKETPTKSRKLFEQYVRNTQGHPGSEEAAQMTRLMEYSPVFQLYVESLTVPAR